MVKVITESEVNGKPISFNFIDERHLYYFKLIGIGPNTLEKTNYKPLDTIRSIDGHLIIGTIEEIRAALHDIVDRSITQQFGASNGGTKESTEKSH